MRKLLRFLQRFVWVYVLLLLLLAVGILFFSPLFRINTLLCTFDERPCPAHLEAELNHYLGQSLLTLRPQTLEYKLRTAEYRADKIQISPLLPHQLRVTITSRVQHLTLAQASNSAQLVVDQNLVPYELVATPSSFPKIVSSQVADIPLGEPIKNPVLKSALQLAQTLDEYFLSYEFIETQNSSIKVRLKPDLMAIFPAGEDFSTLVTSLQLILRESTIQPKPAEIDLRFSKPILR